MNNSPMRAEHARKKRMQNKRVRQTIIFGSLCGVLFLALLFGYSIYTGSIGGPFDREFTAEADPENVPAPPPCPGEDDTPVPYNEVEVNVYNTTDVSGLAASAGDAFFERGFEVGEVGNEKAVVPGSAELRFGPSAIAAAYTVESQLSGAILTLDENRTDHVIDVLVGEAYDELRPTELIELVPDEPFPPLPDCVPVTVPTDEPEGGEDADDSEAPPEGEDGEDGEDDEDAAEDESAEAAA